VSAPGRKTRGRRFELLGKTFVRKRGPVPSPRPAHQIRSGVVTRRNGIGRELELHPRVLKVDEPPVDDVTIFFFGLFLARRVRNL